ncbi:MAG: hypothetical protein K0Q78_2607 [Cellvibrio sp.]|jgi:hypothetical protein|nr:hypothetical protein [Cellvibrio sp.]
MEHELFLHKKVFRLPAFYSCLQKQQQKNSDFKK